jgi:hypothetical protein
MLTCLFYFKNKISSIRLNTSLTTYHTQTSPLLHILVVHWHIDLFVYSLFNKRLLVVRTVSYSVERKDDEWMMICEGCGRKRSWPNLTYHPVICLGILLLGVSCN